jgi:hypothetical protein
MKIILIVVAIFLHTQSEEKVLSSEKIIRLIPNKIEEFSLRGESKSKVIKIGNIKYSMAEKNFSASHDRSIKILLFDYKEAPIMYNQVTRKWSTFTIVESDSSILRPTAMNDCTGWESYNIKQSIFLPYRTNSQILLGVCNRFFLTMEGTNVDLEFLKKVAQGFNFETFPK